MTGVESCPVSSRPDGFEIPLKAGKSWISIVPLSYGIAYK